MAKRKTSSPACSACRVQRKKCSKECVLAPHFPPNDPHKFEIVQCVFGTTHIVKLLRGLKAEQRSDAVNSMVYEATARVKDPVHGCANTIYEMQKRIAELQAQLVATQEELMKMRWAYDKIVFLLGGGFEDAQDVKNPTDTTSQPVEDIMYDEVDSLLLWGPLWEI